MDTKDSLQQRIIGMAEEDTAFRARLLDDPRNAIQEAFDVEIPSNFNLVVHEESVDTAHLVLPPSAELADAQLEQAAGGSSAWTGMCG